MPQERSDELILVALFLSRFGERRDPGSPLPPSELGTTSWASAYAEFYAALGGGRSLEQFHNTLKATRDQFDSHLDSGRVGWLVGKDPKPLPDRDAGIFASWASRDRAEHWDAIKEWADIGVADLSSRVVADVDVGASYTDRTVRTGREGELRVAISYKIERDPRLRAEAIRTHGTTCQACGFDFGVTYGEWGAGYAEVHHRVPLAGVPGPRETDVERDLLVLCANCHRMAHRRRARVLSLEELKDMIQANLGDGRPGKDG